MIPTSAALVLCLLAAASQVAAQSSREALPAARFAGSVPSGEAPAGVLELGLEEAIRRGLERNLGVLLAQHDIDAARGRRRQARSESVPQVSASIAQTSRKINLSAFGLQRPAGESSVVGPFDVFDGRLSLSWNAVDVSSQRSRGAATAELDAARWSVADTEDFLVLAVTDAYLRTVAWQSQVEAVEAQVATALSLRDLAVSRNESGLVAGVEVLRAEVRLQRDRQRLIAAQNDYAKQRLVLSRVIGLPLGSEFVLVDGLEETTNEADDPDLDLGLDESVARAWARRADLRAAEARVDAAARELAAARGERLPAVAVDADYGVLGNDVDSGRETYQVGARLALPLFLGGRLEGQRLEAESSLRAAQAELEDLRAAIFYEVSAVRLDLSAARQEMAVTESAVELSERQLEQARHRFDAGVASNIEVVEAQEEVARANEEWISSLFRYRLDQARLRRALGVGVARSRAASAVVQP